MGVYTRLVGDNWGNYKVHLSVTLVCGICTAFSEVLWPGSLYLHYRLFLWRPWMSLHIADLLKYFQGQSDKLIYLTFSEQYDENRWSKAFHIYNMDSFYYGLGRFCIWVTLGQFEGQQLWLLFILANAIQREPLQLYLTYLNHRQILWCSWLGLHMDVLDRVSRSSDMIITQDCQSYKREQLLGFSYNYTTYIYILWRSCRRLQMGDLDLI